MAAVVNTSNSRASAARASIASAPGAFTQYDDLGHRIEPMIRIAGLADPDVLTIGEARQIARYLFTLCDEISEAAERHDRRGMLASLLSCRKSSDVCGRRSRYRLSACGCGVERIGRQIGQSPASWQCNRVLPITASTSSLSLARWSLKVAITVSGGVGPSRSESCARPSSAIMAAVRVSA